MVGETLHSLHQWYRRQKRVLPWRSDPSLYRVWISEIMLQQTQVITVIPFFEKFMTRFPDVETLAVAPTDAVLESWAGLGYYSRARNLHRGAQKIHADGKFPQTKEEWLEIPGVGPYTAGAIVSIALNQPEPILDGNVERVVTRIRRMPTRNKARMWRLSDFLVKTAAKKGIPPSDFNQALMELGAMICTPKKPKCLLCPMRPLCKAAHVGDPEAYPAKAKKKEWKEVRENLHCILNAQGEVLLRKRKPGEWREGLWDFLDEKPDASLKVEKLGIVHTRHIVTRHRIQRATTLWMQKRKTLSAAERRKFSDDHLGWFSVQDRLPASGSALKKVLKEIDRNFPDLIS